MPLEISFKEQYLKELTFKQKHHECNPSTIDFDTNAKIDFGHINDDFYESVINVDITAIQKKKNIFDLCLSYAGVFQIQNASPQELEILSKQECPRLLFPFVREIVAKISREAGFREIILNPIIF